MIPVVVMGASGSGKTTVGEALAERLTRRFVDGDDLHPTANVQKMAAGYPLDDQDRLPWLRRVADELASHPDVIVACSALRYDYRSLLRERAPSTFFIHLDPPADVLAERLAQRVGHFMPSSLLDSQLAALEALRADEYGIVLDGLSLMTTVDAVVARLGLSWTD